MALFCSTNIVCLSCPVILINFCSGHNLQHWRVKDQAFKEKSPPLENLRIIAKQACSGLAFLHYIGYYHGDVSPKNIMWDKYVHVANGYHRSCDTI